MATTIGKNYCAICNKEKRHTVLCEGCSKTFCFRHLHDHRQELNKQLDEVGCTCDLFRQTITDQMSQSQKHPIIEKINNWERESLNKIQQIAKEARELLSKEITKQTTEIKSQFDNLSGQIRKSRDDNDFIETDFNKWKKELEILNEELIKLKNITLPRDSALLKTKINIDLESFLSQIGAGSSTSENTSRFTFVNFPTRGSQFSLGNNPPGNQPIFSFNQSGDNLEVQQSLGSYTFRSLNQEQQQQTFMNKSQSSIPLTSTTNTMTESVSNIAVTSSKEPSNLPTSVFKQLSASNQAEQETTDDSLLAKKVHTGLRDANTVVIGRSDPNSSLYSLKTFEQLNLKPELLKGIYDMSFHSLSKIQSIALPNLLDNPPKNIIAQSQSGTGKTVAFTLAILSRIDPSIQCPQALIFAPTFDLAVQIGSVIEKMAKFMPYIKVAYAVRDPTLSNRANRVRGQIISEPIVVGTPGTIEDWCRKMRIIHLKQIHVCCVDEADVMIATEGFQDTCANLIREVNPATCQVMLFSATYSDEVMDFARQIVQDPVVLRLKREKQVLVNIEQYYIQCYDDEHKYYAVQNIYAQLTVGQAMIFCRTKKTARDLNIRMSNDGHSVRELTSDLDIEQRATIINGFRQGIFRVLISTNVTPRGLDIDDISLVINYDMPITVNKEPDYETYLHRIGRSGRFGRKGYAFNLIGSENDFMIMKQIEQYFSHPITQITIEQINDLETSQGEN